VVLHDRLRLAFDRQVQVAQTANVTTLLAH
jgi:hypothetical protein